MKFPGQKYRILISGFTFKETLITIGVFLAGLIMTLFSVLYNRQNLRKAAMSDFAYSCNQIRMRIETRLEEHSQLLRGAKGLFAVSDTVTREEWQDFFHITRIEEYLPGIQGIGYALLVKPEEIQEHEERFRKVYADYKPDYNIYPEGEREIYSSIILLEPHNERNKKAIGFDMYSEPVRKKAMEIARDSNMSMLTDKVILVQEIDHDKQPGVLMYDPDYRKDMPAETVEQRRAAIRGWVYSPYRMRDLMQGIRGTMSHYQQEPLGLRIYDGTIISENTLLYDSYDLDSIQISHPNLHLTLQAEFRGKEWTLEFRGRKEEMSIFHNEQLFIWLTGLIITILLFVLSMMYIRTNIRTRQIEKLNHELELLNADKDRFIAILSHDLKSPFTSILGFLELLTSDIKKFSLSQIERHVQTINSAARNTYNLLEDLLMWTRAHSGKIPFNPGKLPFREIYDTAVEILMPVAETKNITVRYVAPDDLQIIADKDMLKTILRNLISNALKFTPPGGRVKISAIRNYEGVTVSISDTGMGIQPSQQQTLFDISKIFPTADTTGEKGTGLGLVLCKEFVETHRGKIWFTSEPGKGSDFRFTMPGN